MSENKLVVERIKRDDDMVEYRLRVCSAHVIDGRMDEIVPSEYIAAYVANALREFVASSKLEDVVIDRVDRDRKFGAYTCPRCGSEVRI